MNKKPVNKKLALLASSLFALLLCAGAAGAGDLSDATLNRLMDLSGVNKQVALIPEGIKSAADAAKQEDESSGNPQLTKKDYANLKAALTDAFRPEFLLQASAAKIKKNVSEADAKEVLAWLESDLGKKITQAEVDAEADEARGNMMNDARALLADKERVAIARELDQLLHGSEDLANLQVQFELTMYVALSKLEHPDRKVDAATFKKQAEAEVDRSNIEQDMILSFVYTYRNIDLADLKKYMAFLKQPAMRRFNDALRDGMLEGLDKCVTKAAENIAVLAKKKRSS